MWNKSLVGGGWGYPPDRRVPWLGFLNTPLNWSQSPLYFSQNWGTMDKELGAALYSMAARNVPALARNLILFYPHHSISIFLDLSAKCLLHLQQVLPRAGVIFVCWKLGGFFGPHIWAKSHLYESNLTKQDQKNVYLWHSSSQFCGKMRICSITDGEEKTQIFPAVPNLANHDDHFLTCMLQGGWGVGGNVKDYKAFL